MESEIDEVITDQQIRHVENERHRHQVSCFVQQIDDCVGECHGKKAVIHQETIIKYTNRNAAHRE